MRHNVRAYEMLGLRATSLSTDRKTDAGYVPFHQPPNPQYFIRAVRQRIPLVKVCFQVSQKFSSSLKTSSLLAKLPNSLSAKIKNHSIFQSANYGLIPFKDKKVCALCKFSQSSSCQCFPSKNSECSELSRNHFFLKSLRAKFQSSKF
jgi:hypothetical protein